VWTVMWFFRLQAWMKCWDENLWRIYVWTTWRRGVSQRTKKGD